MVEGASPAVRTAIAAWAETLLGIRSARDGAFTEASGAFRANADTRIIWPILKRLGKAIKCNAWDKQGRQGRAIAVGGAAAVAFFADGLAAFAAPGSALAVPIGASSSCHTAMPTSIG